MNCKLMNYESIIIHVVDLQFINAGRGLQPRPKRLIYNS